MGFGRCISLVIHSNCFMNNFPRQPGTDTPLTSWLTRQSTATQRLQPGASNTLTTRQGPSGTVFEIDETALPEAGGFHWFGEYQQSSSYGLNAFVKVSTLKTYTDVNSV